MALDLWTNSGLSTLAAGIDAVQTTIPVAAGTGARFPTGNFPLRVWNSTDFANPIDDPAGEIVYCTSRSVDTLTVTRGQEGTAAAAHNTAGKTYSVILPLTKKFRDDVEARLPDNKPIQAADIAAGAVGTTQVADASITQAKLSAGGKGFAAFTASGTWTRPADVTQVAVLLVGGGGGGGGGARGNSTQAGGGGGGGGAGQAVFALAFAVAADQTVTIGAGGTGGAGGAPTVVETDGNPGGTTSFGTLSAVGGGAGGRGSPATGNGGNGGTSGGAGTRGAAGIPGGNASGPLGSGGGGSGEGGGGAGGGGFGTGANGGDGAANANASAGAAAGANTGAGGGGGGGNAGISFSAGNGGAGGSGFVVVWW